jgi:hypothetical protein
MKGIWRRLLYYGIGLFIGVIFVTILFGSRACSWLPENRIKSTVFSQIIALDTTDFKFNPGAFFDDSTFLIMVIDAKVNIGLSQRQGEPKAYYFAREHKTKPADFFQIIFQMDGVVAICEPIGENKMTSTKKREDWLPIIHVPGDFSFISIHEDSRAEVNQYGLSKTDIFEGLSQNGLVWSIAKEEDPEGRKIFQFQFQSAGSSYKFKGKIFQNKLEVLSIQEVL